jgi:capsular exopolysaccharide synthesis family protein
MYNQNPYEVLVDKSKPQLIDVPVKITILNDEEFLIEIHTEEGFLYNFVDHEVEGKVTNLNYTEKFKFGEPIEHDAFSFKVITDPLNKDFKLEKKQELYFTLNHLNYMALGYQKGLEIEPTSITSSVLNVTARGPHYAKVTDFLNKLLNLYLDQNLEKKNNMAEKTERFINEQISGISDSLRYAEANLKNFRSANQVMDLSFQGKQIFEKITKLENEKATLEVQMRYYKYLKEYLENNDDVSDLVAPSSMNVVDPVLTELITKLISLNSERVSLADNTTSKNLYLKNLDIQINNLKNTILESVNNNINTIGITLNELDYRMEKLSGQITKLPKTELQLLGIERKFKLNDAIYTFLLQKRSEAQIARASSSPDYEVIDEARVIVPKYIFPKKKLNYIIALFIGVMFPVGTILAMDFLNNKIREPEEVRYITNKSIVGNIPRNSEKVNRVLDKVPESTISESFRHLRTNIDFYIKETDSNVVTVTSSISGEGKTFTSMNLATAFAIAGRRSLLVEFDLRRPRIHGDFNTSTDIGLSSYLVDKASLGEIIQPTEIENLDLITAGQIPPNPAELINAEKIEELLKLLKEIYDVIIIDSAPVGIVAESAVIMKYSDINLYVFRYNYTDKDEFRDSLESLDTNNITHFSLVANEVTHQKSTYKYEKAYYGNQQLKKKEKKRKFFKF